MSADVLETLKKLPEMCYAKLRSTGQVIAIRRGESGYHPVAASLSDMVTNKCHDHGLDLDKINAGMGCSIAQREAMLAGSMFGWETPAADPDNYDEDGKFKKSVLAKL